MMKWVSTSAVAVCVAGFVSACTAQPSAAPGDNAAKPAESPLLGGAKSGGLSDKDSIVQPTLLANVTAVKPGTSFLVGVKFKLQPDWHIYYKNPGESGFATTVKWGLPEGASVGETLYPAPLMFESPGPVTSYGYEGETMLLARVNVPTAPADGKITITAKANWLMCSDRCIPNKKDLTLTLPVGEPQPANAADFDKYQKLVPPAAEQLPEAAKLTTTPSGSSMNYEITITPPEGKTIAVGGEASESHVPFFYPAIAKGYVLTAPEVDGKAIDAGGIKVYDGPVKITWKAAPETNTAEPLKRLDGVLVYQLVSDGKLDAPVLAEVSQKL